MSALTRIYAKSGWIPLAFVGFFAVVLVANGAMIYFAYESWTGIETANAYERGLHYNETLERRAKQDALGWQVFVAFSPEGERTGDVNLWVSDANGKWLAKADITASFVRPTYAGYDRDFGLERRSAGHYGAEVALPLSGQWDLRITIMHGGDEYRTVRRIEVP